MIDVFWTQMTCPRSLSFSQFVLLMSMTNCEKDISTVSYELSQFSKYQIFLTPFNMAANRLSQQG